MTVWLLLIMYVSNGQPMAYANVYASARTLLVAVALLASAATAHADCAWVLWVMSGSSPWSVSRAFATREACIEAIHTHAATLDRRVLKVTEDPSGGSFIANARGNVLRGQCLPDTVDPRGAKGSR